MMKIGLFAATAWVVCLALAAGCADSTYRLPAPASADDRAAPESRDGAGQKERREERDPYLEARARLLTLYKFLSEERFEEAEELLSQQTREFLAHRSPGDASHSLSTGEITLAGGRRYRFDPIEFLIGGRIVSITDAVDGAEEHETERRRELFVIDPEGEAHRVVMIREAGEWVLHKTSANLNAARDEG